MCEVPSLSFVAFHPRSPVLLSRASFFLVLTPAGPPPSPASAPAQPIEAARVGGEREGARGNVDDVGDVEESPRTARQQHNCVAPGHVP